MNFDPTFTYALDYFDGLMGTFFPTVWRLAMIMAILGVAWSGVQIAFGTMEVRKGAVGFITKLALFWVVLACYPMFCIGLRTFAFKLGQLGGSETSNSVVDMVDTYIKQLDDKIALLERVKKADVNDPTSAALIKTYYKNRDDFDKDKDRITDTIAEYTSLKKSLNKIIPLDEDGKRHLRLELTKKASNRASAASNEDAISVDRDKKGNRILVKEYREGLMSLDTVFKLALLSAQIMKEKEWDHDVLRASLDMQNEQWIKLGKGQGDEKLSENVRKRGGSVEDALVAAESLGKATTTLTTMPMKPMLRYIEVCICSIFLIVLTIVCLIQYAMQMIEYNIVTGFSIILIPLMLFEGTKDYAMKIIAMLFAEAVKLALLVLMMYYEIGLFGAICKVVMAQQGKAFGLAEMSFVVFSAILGFALVSNAPKLASTIVTGQPQMSMGEFVGAAAAMGGAVGAAGTAAVMGGTRVGGGAVGLGKGVVGGVSAARDVLAGGGSWKHAIASGIGHGAAQGANNLLDALKGKGSGSAKASHFSQTGKSGADFRQQSKVEAAQAKIAAKGVDALNGTGSAMRKSSMQDSKAMAQAGIKRSSLDAVMNQVYGTRRSGGAGAGGAGTGKADPFEDGKNLANRHLTDEQMEKATRPDASNIMDGTKDVTDQFI